MVPIIATKPFESITRIIAQHVKPIKPLYYPCIICSSTNHQFGDYPKKTRVQKIFQFKVFNTTTITSKHF